MFAFNFVLWMLGAVLMGIGVYAAIENWKQGQGKFIVRQWMLEFLKDS